MIGQRNLRQFLAIVAAIIALPQPQALGESIPPPNQISPQKPNIAPILPTEYFVDGTSSLDGKVDNTATYPNLSLTPPNFQSVDRDFVWQLSVRLDMLPSQLNNSDVIYALNSNSTVSVEVEGLEIDVISRDQANNTAVVQGKVRLKFAASTFKVAGNYKGLLSVCVKDKNGACL